MKAVMWKGALAVVGCGAATISTSAWAQSRQVVVEGIPTSACPVKKVVVHGGGLATVTRETTFNPSATGYHELVIPGLSFRLDPSSIRVKVGTASGSKILPLRVIDVHAEVAESRPSNEDYIQAEGEVEAIQDDIDRCRNEIDSVESRKRLHMRRARYFVKEMAHDRESCDDEITHIEDTLREAGEDIMALEVRQRELRKDLEVAEEKLDMLREQKLDTYDVTCLVDVGAITEPIRLGLSYTVRDAHWTPAYDVHVHGDSQDLSISYYGEVTQQTGEDWDGCTLHLSTAPVERPAGPPFLRKRLVEAGPPMELFRKKSVNREMAFESAAEVRSIPACADAGVVGTATDTAVTFTVPHPVSVPSHKLPTKVRIADIRNLKADYVHCCVPSGSPAAYLKVASRNETPYHLLPSGRVNIFSDGSLVAKSILDGVHPGGRIMAFLGEDRGVQVEYSPVSSKRKGGMLVSIGAPQKMEEKRNVVLRNTKDTAVTVLVVQQLPVSSDGKVEVTCQVPPKYEKVKLDTDFDVTANGVFLNETTHNLIWRTTIPPKQAVEVPYEYTVHYPSGDTLRFRDA